MLDDLARRTPLTFPSDWDLPAFEETPFRFSGAARTSRYCIVIPVINEGERLLNQLRGMGAAKFADIIIADGGSTDGSTDPDVLRDLGRYVLLTKKSPVAQSTQLRMAFAWALASGYSGIVGIDGNGKDGWEAIPSAMPWIAAVAFRRGLARQVALSIPLGEAPGSPALGSRLTSDQPGCWLPLHRHHQRLSRVLR